VTIPVSRFFMNAFPESLRTTGGYAVLTADAPSR
jgi:hypothetical protein